MQKQICVVSTKTISEYKIPKKIMSPEEDYRVWRLEQLRKNWNQIFQEALAEERAKNTKSFINKTMPNRTFKNEINETDTYHENKRKYQLNTNLAIIADIIEPPKPKYPTLEEYCHYCTDGNCEQCSICEQIEEQTQRNSSN